MISPVLFGIFAVCVFLSVPIAISLGLGSLAIILIFKTTSVESFAQTMIRGLDNFPLIAVPLFTFAANVMGKGGISKRLINVSKIFFGRITGGLGIISIVTCMFFAAISGTGSATVAAVGMVMIPAMVANNYNREFASALVASAGGIGALIPPSVCMVVYSVVANVSVTSMFMAGVFPGILVGIFLIVYTYICSRKAGYVGDPHRYSLKEAAGIIFDALPALFVPVIILGGIYGGVMTPTEAAAAASVYGIIVSVFLYKEVKIRDLSYIVFHSVLLCAVVLLIIGISTGFGQIITLAQIPQKLAAAVLSVTTSKVIIILAINILLLFVGCIMETNAAIIILVPIMLPIVQQLQMSFVHFGLIVIMNLFIGFVTPPFGADLFMTCQVGGVKFEALCKAIVPWILVMLVALVLVVIVPDISLFLPKLLGRTI